MENTLGNALRVQPLAAQGCQHYYIGNINITNSNLPLFLLPETLRHTFTVTSCPMFIARGLFLGLQSEDQHGNISKLRFVCKFCMRRENLDMNVIGFSNVPSISDTRGYYTVHRAYLQINP